MSRGAAKRTDGLHRYALAVRSEIFQSCHREQADRARRGNSRRQRSESGMKIDKPGIFYDMSADDYFADPAPDGFPSLTQSLCKILIEQSPLHAKMAHPRLAPPINEEDETVEKYDGAKAIGNAAHFLMLQRGKKIKIIEQKNFTTKHAKQEKQAGLAAGLEPVLIKHWDIAVAMSRAAWSQLGRIDRCHMEFAE